MKTERHTVAAKFDLAATHRQFFADHEAMGALLDKVDFGPAFSRELAEALKAIPRRASEAVRFHERGGRRLAPYVVWIESATGRPRDAEVRIVSVVRARKRVARMHEVSEDHRHWLTVFLFPGGANVASWKLAASPDPLRIHMILRVGRLPPIPFVLDARELHEAMAS